MQGSPQVAETAPKDWWIYKTTEGDLVTQEKGLAPPSGSELVCVVSGSTPNNAIERASKLPV